jgi:acyl-coenzyme A thioesterase PaaI-like protein
MSPFEMLRQQLQTSVPYAAHTGVDVVEIGAGVARTQLAQRSETENHIASQHAGAMFTLGEAASGAAMAGAFLAQIANLRPVAANAQIRYVKVAKGLLTANAKVAGDVADLMAQLGADGKVQFGVDVVISDDSGDAVAEMSVDWYLSQKR